MKEKANYPKKKKKNNNNKIELFLAFRRKAKINARPGRIRLAVASDPERMCDSWTPSDATVVVGSVSSNWAGIVQFTT